MQKPLVGKKDKSREKEKVRVLKKNTKQEDERRNIDRKAEREKHEEAT